MGYARRRPKRLGEKLLQIRNGLGLSQSEMCRRLQVEDEIPYTRISDFELDKAEPTLMTLLQYARISGLPMEVLVDDYLDLPVKLPGPASHEESRRKSASPRKKR
ncbi:MAG TPA: helix-turn-helix transcriptional regulator [Pyrinomonadaceae bacterium]|jgi:transcriptional regulator with XRE-family HTH domain